MDFTAIFNRTKQIILNPLSEWQVIKTETKTIQDLIVGYAMVLALIPLIVGIVTDVIMNTEPNELLFNPIIFYSVGYIISIAGLFVTAYVIDVIAPSFGSTNDFTASFKVAVYPVAIVWVASVFKIIPILGILAMLAAAIYSLYVLYTGLRIVKSVPNEKMPLYFIIIMIVNLVLNFFITILIGAIFLMTSATQA